MIHDILNRTEKAAEVLAAIRTIPKESLKKEVVIQALRKAINLKLMISEKEEINIEKLVILSIKRQNLDMGNLPEDVIQKHIIKYDCHQTSLVIQKKVLLLMFIEKELGITLNDDEAIGIETLDDLAKISIRYLKEGS